MSKSELIHTLSESKNVFTLEQKTIVLSFVKMLRFYWDTVNAKLKVSLFVFNYQTVLSFYLLFNILKKMLRNC